MRKQVFYKPESTLPPFSRPSPPKKTLNKKKNKEG